MGGHLLVDHARRVPQPPRLPRTYRWRIHRCSSALGTSSGGAVLTPDGEAAILGNVVEKVTKHFSNVSTMASCSPPYASCSAGRRSV